MKLSEKTLEAINHLQKQYPHARSALIPALHLAQNEIGFLPREIQKQIAEVFSIDFNEVHSIVSFYDMFHEEKLGKHVLHVCKNISCMLRGADELIDGLCHHLKVKPFEVSSDGNFTIIPSECLGACDRAPMMLVDDKVVGPVQINEIAKILEDAKLGPGHASPVVLEDILESENVGSTHV